MKKLLILLGLVGTGVGVYWFVRKRQTPDGPSPMLPAGVGKGVLPGSGEIPAVGVDAQGNVTVAPEPYVSPPTANIATDDQPVVVQATRTAAEQAQYDAEQQAACALDAYYWSVYGSAEAGRGVQRCREEGWL